MRFPWTAANQGGLGIRCWWRDIKNKHVNLSFFRFLPVADVETHHRWRQRTNTSLTWGSNVWAWQAIYCKRSFLWWFSLDANIPHLRYIKVPDTLMKDSLIQIYLFTYERSTNMILNTDENPLLTLYDMFYFYCMYISTWTVKRAILVEGWSESAFEMRVGSHFPSLSSKGVRRWYQSKRAQGRYYHFNWNKRCSRWMISWSRPQLYCDQRLHQLIIAFNHICSAAKSFEFRQKFLIDFMKGLIECLSFANKQSKVNLLKWHNQLQQFVAICVVKAILDSILGISSSINQRTQIPISPPPFLTIPTLIVIVTATINNKMIL